MSTASVCLSAEALLNGCKSSGNGVYRNRGDGRSSQQTTSRNDYYTNQTEYQLDAMCSPRAHNALNKTMGKLTAFQKPITDCHDACRRLGYVGTGGR